MTYLKYLLVTIVGLGRVIGSEYRIKNANELIEFSNTVNSGSNQFDGTTVFLDSDITFTDELSAEFNIIGNTTSYYFKGVLDGQGHVINNLNISTSLDYVGLFGYSDYGITIKNTVLDSTCTIKSTRVSGSTYVGAFIGNCISTDVESSIMNNINMGSVIYSGGGGNLYLGGIIGRITYSGKQYKFINCANYGPIVKSGTSTNTYIGGIAGFLGTSSSYNENVHNCINYGSITHSGSSTTTLYVGGIIGRSYNTYIENCVSAGKITTSSASTKYLGSIVGVVYSGGSINNCYWASNVGVSNIVGEGTPKSLTDTSIYNADTFTLTQSVTSYNYTGTSLVDALNAGSLRHYTYNTFSHWALNKNKKSVKFTITDRESFLTLDAQLILLPSLMSGDMVFGGWYTDDKLSSPLEAYEITVDTELYGSWEENADRYTVTFDTRGGTPIAQMTGKCGSVIPLPNTTTKEYCNFSWWENDYGDVMGWNFVVPGHNITLRAVWRCSRIRTAEDFVSFSKIVNSGKDNFTGSAVFLDSDIDVPSYLLQQFSPIGNTTSNYFRGAFNGQGHVIRNLNIKSALEYTGLFGYSKYGITIKNTVLDSTCSVTSTHGSSASYVGAFIGYCYSNDVESNIMNNINMGSVTFSGDASNNLYLGGIIGYARSYSSNIVDIRNCANYGAIVKSGTSTTTYIGGIVGNIYQKTYYKYVQNCINYGTITHSGSSTTTLYVGGIVGRSYYSYIENCVSAGKITTSSASTKYLGYIVGSVNSNTYINYCYWKNGIGPSDAVGEGTPKTITGSSYDENTFNLAQSVAAYNYTGTSLINALTSFVSRQYTSNTFSYWVLNKGKKNMGFTLNGKKLSFVLNSQLVLLPNLMNGENMYFDGWYTDDELSSPLKTREITIDTELYGLWEENTDRYTVTFDTRGGTPIAQILTKFDTVILLPNTTTKEYCEFSWWENDYGDVLKWNFVVPEYNVILHAVWRCSRIGTTEDFVSFSKIVNSGKDNFTGSTVFLDSDIDIPSYLLQQFSPIGNASSRYFRGVFDGQGHVIRNLNINTTLRYAGLFGYSKYGITIKNTVLDSTCSVTSTYNSNAPYVGAFIGYCYSNDVESNIMNNINMGSVTFSEETGEYIAYLGGFIGYSRLNSNSIVGIRNCANYGAIVKSGTSATTYIGGITGYLQHSSNYKYVQNCINYGSITHSGSSTTTLYVGGIMGDSYYSYIENCVSAGKIIVPTGSATNRYIGSIVGSASTNTYTKNCYWASDIGYSKIAGSGTPTDTDDISIYNADTFTLTQSVTAYNYTGTSLVDALNAGSLRHYTYNIFSHWILNKNKKSVKFTIADRESFLTLDAQLILLPSLMTEKDVGFDGWYTDDKLSAPLEAYEITFDTELYGSWEENADRYTINFDTRGGTPIAQMTGKYGSVILLPNTSTKEYCEFSWWENDYGDVIDWNFIILKHNIILRAVWRCSRIRTAEDFVSFSKIVNSGKDNFTGSTVFLDSDIDIPSYLLQQFNPIGNTTSRYFRGVFDGQGHVIRNLNIKSALQYTGLFGYSKYGITIKNTILDSTCSVTSTYGSNELYVGAFIGYCYSNDVESNIMNNINMGSVTFSGDVSNNLYLGGIIGYARSYSSNIACIRNCANYGAIVKSGTSTTTYIGGIVGYLIQSSYYKYVQNCINYGTITHSGSSTTTLYVGGIAGRGHYSYIENCVSAGKITTSSASTKYLGYIVGSVRSYTYINNCYWTSDVGASVVAGDGTPKSTISCTVSSLDSALVNSLNNQSSHNGWNGWLFNENKKSITFKVNNDKGFSLSSQVILLPDPINVSFDFSGWYTDSYYESPFQPGVITEDTTLHSLYGLTVVVTFNATKGTVDRSSKNVSVYNTYGELPTPTNSAYVYIGWYTKPSGGILVDSSTFVSVSVDHTLYARWSLGNFTISFEPNGGSECANITQECETSFTLPTPKRTGYTFIFWCSDADLTTEYTNREIEPRNITLYALWDANNYTLTFDTKGGNTENSINVTFRKNYKNLPVPVKEGSQFLGWFLEDTQDKIDESKIVEIARNHTLCAGWDVNLVTFNTTGGYDNLTPMSVTYNQKYGNLPTATRLGYTFIEWFNENGETVTNDTTVTVPYPHTLYARWVINTHVVRFDYDNGDEPIEIVYEYNDVFECPSDDPTKIGYTFAGWDNTTNIVPDYDLTVTAKWMANNYTVTLDVNGGDKFTDNNVTVTYNSTYYNLPTPTKTGYSFTEWLTDEDEKITNIATVTIADNHTLHAQWTADSYTVTLDVNGGNALDENTFTVTFDSTYYNLPVPIRKGYAFTGWFTDKNVLITKDTIVNITGDHTLQAHWDEILTSHVEIVFASKDLTDEKIEEIVRQFTDAEFTITKIEDENTGEIRVIIKFVDIEQAEEFVHKVQQSSGSAKEFIRDIDFSNEKVTDSISPVLYPFMNFNIIML